MFSVVIPTYKRPESLKKLIEQITRDVGDVSAEILVVDDDVSAQAKAVAEAFKDSPVSVHYIQSGGIGPGLARNMGVGKTSGDFLVFIDDDCEVPEGWLKILAKGLADFPEGKIFHGPIQSATPGIYPFLQVFDEEESPYHASNFAIEKKLFETMGGFDPKLSRWAEDWDLVTRLQKKGYPISYLPEWTCKHPSRYQRPDYFQVKHTQEETSRMRYLLRKHHDATHIRAYVSGFFHKALVHLMIRLSALLIPLTWLSFERSLLIFILFNMAYDSFRLLRAQYVLMKRGFEIPLMDALMYLLLNWSEDLRRAIQAVIIWWTYFKLQQRQSDSEAFQSEPVT